MKAKIYLNKCGNGGDDIFFCEIDISFTPFLGLTFWIIDKALSKEMMNIANDFLGLTGQHEFSSGDNMGLCIDYIAYAIYKDETIMSLYVTNET